MCVLSFINISAISTDHAVPFDNLLAYIYVYLQSNRMAKTQNSHVLVVTEVHKATVYNVKVMLSLFSRQWNEISTYLHIYINS